MASRPTTGEIADRSHGADHVIDALCFSRPSAPRVDHYLLGGEAVYELDRAAGDALLTAVPGLRDMVRARRAFVARCVRHFVESGLDQIVDLGCGLPTAWNVHQVAHAVNSDARVLYVDHDPVVLQYAWTYLAGPGAEVVTADVRDTRLLLAALHEEGMLDLHRPAGVLLTGVLDVVTGHDLIATLTGLRKSLAPGSRLALTHLCADRLTGPEAARLAEVYGRTQTPIHLRGRTAIESMLTGFDIDEPGLVELYPWGPDEGGWPVDNSFILGGTGTLRRIA